MTMLYWLPQGRLIIKVVAYATDLVFCQAPNTGCQVSGVGCQEKKHRS